MIWFAVFAILGNLLACAGYTYFHISETPWFTGEEPAPRARPRLALPRLALPRLASLRNAVAAWAVRQPFRGDM